MDEVRCISLWEPWATLVATGEKTIETRSWKTSYRGLVAIHATRAYPAEAVLACEDGVIAAALSRNAPPLSLPPFAKTRGRILALATLTDIQPAEDIAAELEGLAEAGDAQAARELRFGNYCQGRYAWALQDVKRLPAPLVYSGSQGLRQLGPDETALILQQIRHLEAHVG